jgi:hypothetical protein
MCREVEIVVKWQCCSEDTEQESLFDLKVDIYFLASLSNTVMAL